MMSKAHLGQKAWNKGKKLSDVMSSEKYDIYIRKNRERILKRYESGDFPRQTHTKIELLMKNELIRRGYKEGIDFIHQFKFRNKFMCDFVFPKQRVVVECDGDFWHANPAKYAGKPLKQAQKNTVRMDKAKSAYIKKVDGGSWTLLRFWGSDINKNVELCVDKVEAKLTS